MSDSQYTQSNSVQGSISKLQMPTGVYYMGVHINAIYF